MVSRKLEAPAVGLMVAAALDAAFSVLSLLWHVGTRLTLGRMLCGGLCGHPHWAMGFFPFGFGIAWPSLSLLVDAAMIYGAVQMRRGESYGWALVAALLAVIPCLSSPCCCLGIPFGVWALVVLLGEEGRQSFASAPERQI